MFSFEFHDYQSVVILGLSILGLVFVLSWNVWRLRTIVRPGLLTEIHEHDDSLKDWIATVAKQTEARLGDFARAVEGRTKSKIAVLDRLIVDADREIIRLQQVLAESRRTGTKLAGTSRQPDAIVQYERRDVA